MRKATKFLPILLSLLIFSCTSRTEQIVTGMAPFVENRFPTAEYSVGQTNNEFLFTISTNSEIQKSELDEIMISTLGEFYKNFYLSSNEAATKSTLQVTIKSSSGSWSTRKYDLFELGEKYEIN